MTTASGLWCRSTQRRIARGVAAAAAAGIGLGMLSAPALAASHVTHTIAAGGFHSCSIQATQAYCWGGGFEGELGDGSNVSSSIPVAVYTNGALAGKSLVQIENGANSTCALDSTGKAFCWGDDSFGELGNGSTTDSSVPVQVSASGALGGRTITQISGGNGMTCALDTTGRAYCWGQGPLGDGGTENSDVPVKVSAAGALAGKTLVRISNGYETSTGQDFACALDSIGKAYCWGNNTVGELGNGTTRIATVPAAVGTGGALAGKTLTQITAGNGFSCALDTASKAYCWGANSEGQLGSGSTTSGSSVPVTVSTSGALAGKTLTQITAGSDDACVLDSTGKAYCWGAGADDELGNGGTTLSRVPVPVFTGGALAGKTLTQINTGGYHTCAVDIAGAAYCWGDDSFGELGDNVVTANAKPVLAGPDAPAAVIAKPGNGTAAVSWKAPSDLDGGTLTGYTATAQPGSLTCGTSHITNCTIKGLSNGTAYTVTVVVRTTAGRSGASAPATVTPASNT